MAAAPAAFLHPLVPLPWLRETLVLAPWSSAHRCPACWAMVTAVGGTAAQGAAADCHLLHSADRPTGSTSTGAVTVSPSELAMQETLGMPEGSPRDAPATSWEPARPARRVAAHQAATKTSSIEGAGPQGDPLPARTLWACCCCPVPRKRPGELSVGTSADSREPRKSPSPCAPSRESVNPLWRSSVSATESPLERAAESPLEIAMERPRTSSPLSATRTSSPLSATRPQGLC